MPLVAEHVLDGEDPAGFCARISAAKALCIASEAPQSVVIAADTIVVLGAKILGKPRDRHEAAAFLRIPRKRAHDVFTGYTIVQPGRSEPLTRVVRTSVSFGDMSTDEIDWYIATGEPMDKAGAYAIQGLGGVFIERIAGSHTNVIGLPLAELYHDLKSMQLPLKPMQGG